MEGREEEGYFIYVPCRANIQINYSLEDLVV